MGARDLLRLVRWPGALTAAANALTAFLVMHERTTREEAVAGCAAALGGALVYAGGVVLNDVADAERDKTLHPARPIPSGATTKGAAETFGFALLVLGAGVVFWLAGPASAAATAAAGLFAVLYDFGTKRFRVLGAGTLGLARAANGLAGALAGAAFPLVLDAHLAHRTVVYVGALLAYATLLTFVSTFEGGPADKRTSGASALSLFVIAALPWATFVARWKAGPVFAYVPLLATLVAAARGAAEPDGPGMALVVRAGVFGFLLVDAAWLLGVGRYDLGLGAILLYVAMRLVLARARS